MTAHAPSHRAATLVALAALIVVGCAPPADDPAVTTLEPPPGPFNGSVEVTFTTDKPATVHVTTDGSDPRQGGDHVVSGDSPLTISLDSSAVVSVYSVTPKGAEESLRSVQYVRAGGPKGSISGAVVVGSLALGHEVVLQVGLEQHALGTPTGEGELEFELADLRSGNHRLVAIADTDDDGNFNPFTDFTSDVRVLLDLDDPFQASAENVRIYLGASPPDLGTLTGTVLVPNATGSENLSISALSGNAFAGGADPASLLSQLMNGYRLFTEDGTEAYPYVITDLDPGLYMPVPLLTSFSGAGIGLNFLANVFSSVALGSGEVRKADFAFGPVQLSGTVTLRTSSAVPSPPPSSTDESDESGNGDSNGGTAPEEGDGDGDDNGSGGEDGSGGGDGSDDDDEEDEGEDPGEGGEPDGGDEDGSGEDDGDDGSTGGDLPNFVYGVVAARHFAILSGSVQAVIMPVVFTPGSEGELRGRYLGRGLKSRTSFELRVFTSLAPENPATAALSWLISFDGIGGGPSGVVVRTDSDNVEYDFDFEL